MITNNLSDISRVVRFLIKDNLKTDGQNVFEYVTDNAFNLSEIFVKADTIRVYLNNVLLDNADWDYDEDTNRVIVDPQSSGVELTKSDLILITYSYYRRYSETEVYGHIESSLSYFVQHRYKKVFDVVNDEILAINDVNPTVSELNFIALIAAICIDPQNVGVDTPEFKITANREESDQTQIAKAFTQFKRFVGNVDFYVVSKEIW